MGAERTTQLEDTLVEWRKTYELKELWLEGLVISIRPGDEDGGVTAELSGDDDDDDDGGGGGG
eukprot:1686881-Prymnesium_polylepis.1